MSTHDTRLDDPSKITICGYKATDLIRIASLLKSSDVWMSHGNEISQAMDPAMDKLITADNIRLADRKINSPSELAKRVTDRQTQRLRMLHMILGWSLHEISVESESIRLMMEEWRTESFQEDLKKCLNRS